MSDIKYLVEVVLVPVADVDRSIEFYGEKLGFSMDGDFALPGGGRFVQFTPPGSGCSIVFGEGISDATPGSYRETYIVVADIEAARNELTGRGAEIGEIHHFTKDGIAPGVEANRADFASMARFSDPDGNTFVLQEVPSRASSDQDE